MHIDLVRDASKTFPKQANRDAVRSAKIWYCKYKSIAPLADMTGLTELVIAGLPDDNLSFLSGLVNLRYLSILHMPRISDLAALSKLIQLESLSLATSPAWDAAQKCLTVASIDPISEIYGLKHIELFGVCPPTKRLQALLDLEKLETGRFSQYPDSEVAIFYQKTGAQREFNPKPAFEIKELA